MILLFLACAAAADPIEGAPPVPDDASFTTIAQQIADHMAQQKAGVLPCEAPDCGEEEPTDEEGEPEVAETVEDTDGD